MPAASPKQVKNRKLKESSQRWLKRHLADPYVAKSKQEGYRSRAAYKLLELDSKFRFLKPGSVIVDLGNAPGGWSQVAVQKKSSFIMGIDLIPVKPLQGAVFVTGDFTNEVEQGRLIALLGGRQVDVVLSDIAPNTTGMKDIDSLRLVGILEEVISFSDQILKTGGTLVMKVFDGSTVQGMMTDLKKKFSSVKHVKPPASRKESKEFYLVAQGYRKI